ncbi:MAG TPA: division/cell wall cluster transcriptional repressor MraZ [Thermoleophilia bacterium]|nr:division/cell wall cluster transcriptional repressor MraZ [Thermoleophilia bacterium]
MARFFGRYEHSLDAKGRVILPARFRAELGTRAFLSKHNERCLALWTPEEFDKKLAEMELLQETGRAERNLARVWAAGSAEVEIDRQGRLAIPATMREFARLEGDVLVMGAINRVELWDPPLWSEQVEPSERQLTEEEDTPNTPQD